MKISVIVCYTNHEVMNEMEGYLLSQTCAQDLEIIAIDNSKNTFTSAASALNYGGDKAKGEVLVFMHQDVLLTDCNALQTIYDYLKKTSVPTIIGIAGAGIGNFEVYSAIYETREKIVRYNHSIKEPTPVETLDECLLAVKKEHFKKFTFDEITCADWHLYGAEMSLNYKLNGGDVICLPIEAIHLSCGNITDGFYFSLKKLIKKYRKKIPMIYTTCVNISTKIIPINLIILKNYLRKFKNKIANNTKTEEKK